VGRVETLEVKRTKGCSVCCSRQRESTVGHVLILQKLSCGRNVQRLTVVAHNCLGLSNRGLAEKVTAILPNEDSVD
jgi:hypothetical protein